MTDEPTPDAPDERDPRIAELLEVAPLDDLTRRRLVDRAMAASEPVPAGSPAGGRRLFAIAIAAAAALVFVGGVGALVLLGDDGGGGDGGSKTAARPPVAAEADAPSPPSAAGGGTDQQQRSASTAPQAAPDAGALDLTVPAELGELGDVSDPARLRAAGAAAFTDANRLAPASEALATATCPDGASVAGLALFARATGSVDGRPVVVLFGQAQDGARRALVLDAGTCRRLSTLTL